MNKCGTCRFWRKIEIDKNGFAPCNCPLIQNTICCDTSKTAFVCYNDCRHNAYLATIENFGCILYESIPVKKEKQI